jgi:hypothetical protein
MIRVEHHLIHSSIHNIITILQLHSPFQLIGRGGNDYQQTARNSVAVAIAIAAARLVVTFAISSIFPRFFIFFFVPSTAIALLLLFNIPLLLTSTVVSRLFIAFLLPGITSTTIAFPLRSAMTLLLPTIASTITSLLPLAIATAIAFLLVPRASTITIAHFLSAIFTDPFIATILLIISSSTTLIITTIGVVTLVVLMVLLVVLLFVLIVRVV